MVCLGGMCCVLLRFRNLFDARPGSLFALRPFREARSTERLLKLSALVSRARSPLAAFSFSSLLVSFVLPVSSIVLYCAMRSRVRDTDRMAAKAFNF